MKIYHFSDGTKEFLGTLPTGTHGSVCSVKTSAGDHSLTFVDQQMLQLLFNKKLNSVSCICHVECGNRPFNDS